MVIMYHDTSSCIRTNVSARPQDMVVRGSLVLDKPADDEWRLTIMRETPALVFTGEKTKVPLEAEATAAWWRWVAYALSVVILLVFIWTSSLWWKLHLLKSQSPAI